MDRKLRGRVLLLNDSIGVWISGEMLSLSMKAPLNTTLTRLVGKSEYVPARILKNLQASFNSERTNVGIYAAIAYGRQTKLIMVRKRTPAERVSATDRLGLNAVQYATEFHEPHLIPFLESFEVSPDHLMLVVDGASWHKGPENTKLRKDSGYSLPSWPPNSPDLNPIKNLWVTVKRRLREMWAETGRRPHSAQELFEQAVVE